MTARSQLDHLILLVPSTAPNDIEFVVDAGFDTIVGGRHADGITENVLVVLEDGVCEYNA